MKTLQKVQKFCTETYSYQFLNSMEEFKIQMEKPQDPTHASFYKPFRRHLLD